jgi:sulfur carrier protein
MKIICNGEEKEVAAGIKLGELISRLELNPDTVVAECDGRIIQRMDYDAFELSENSKLELIRFVGGG